MAQVGWSNCNYCGATSNHSALSDSHRPQLCTLPPGEKQHYQKIVGRRFYVESFWFVAVYNIYLSLPNIGALADHPSAKEGNSAKWTKKGFEKKENILIDNLLMIRNLLLLLHK